MTLYEGPDNPYKEILGRDRWASLNPRERFEVIKRALVSGDESLDRVSFGFRVKGLPRHQFAQHVRARIGIWFDYQDPPETPDHFIPYTPVYHKMFLGSKAPSEEGGYYYPPDTSVVISRAPEGYSIQEENGVFTILTPFGRKVVDQFFSIPKGRWKEVRDYLPLCYEQPYSFKATFRAIMGQCSRRLCLGEEAQIVACHYLQKFEIARRFPLMASVLTPACLKHKKCLYAKSYTLSNVFGCLFSGCDYRFPKGTGYALFNQSCSDIRVLRREISPKGIVDQMDALELPTSFEGISDLDRILLEEE